MRYHYYKCLAALVKLYLTCIYISITTKPTEQMHYFSEEDCTDDVQDLDLCGNVTSSAFHYNFITKTCEQVSYRGCSPTRNHFKTLEECNALALNICSALKVFGKEDCHQVPQPCSVGTPRGFQFDVGGQRCRPVVMGDCSRLTNYFKTERDCRRITRLVCNWSTEHVKKVTEAVTLKTDSPKYSSGLGRTTDSLKSDLDKVRKPEVITTSTPVYSSNTDMQVYPDYTHNSDMPTYPGHDSPKESNEAIYPDYPHNSHKPAYPGHNIPKESNEAMYPDYPHKPAYPEHDDSKESNEAIYPDYPHNLHMPTYPGDDNPKDSNEAANPDYLHNSDNSAYPEDDHWKEWNEPINPDYPHNLHIPTYPRDDNTKKSNEAIHLDYSED